MRLNKILAKARAFLSSSSHNNNDASSSSSSSSSLGQLTEEQVSWCHYAIEQLAKHQPQQQQQQPNQGHHRVEQQQQHRCMHMAHALLVRLMNEVDFYFHHHLVVVSSSSSSESNNNKNNKNKNDNTSAKGTTTTAATTSSTIGPKQTLAWMAQVLPMKSVVHVLRGWAHVGTNEALDYCINAIWNQHLQNIRTYQVVEPHSNDNDSRQRPPPPPRRGLVLTHSVYSALLYACGMCRHHPQARQYANQIMETLEQEQEQALLALQQQQQQPPQPPSGQDEENDHNHHQNTSGNTDDDGRTSSTSHNRPSLLVRASQLLPLHLYHEWILVHASRAATEYGAAAQAEDILLKVSHLASAHASATTTTTTASATWNPIDATTSPQPRPAAHPPAPPRAKPRAAWTGPTTETFNRVLRAWVESPENKALVRARDILQLMMRLQRQEQQSPETTTTTTTTTTTMGPNPHSFATLIAAHAKRGEPVLAQQVWEMAVDYFTTNPSSTTSDKTMEVQHVMVSPVDVDNGEQTDNNNSSGGIETTTATTIAAADLEHVNEETADPWNATAEPPGSVMVRTDEKVDLTECFNTTLFAWANSGRRRRRHSSEDKNKNRTTSTTTNTNTTQNDDIDDTTDNLTDDVVVVDPYETAVQAMQELFRKVPEYNNGPVIVQPNVKSYESRISLYLHHERVHEADALLRQLAHEFLSHQPPQSPQHGPQSPIRRTTTTEWNDGHDCPDENMPNAKTENPEPSDSRHGGGGSSSSGETPRSAVVFAAGPVIVVPWAHLFQGVLQAWLRKGRRGVRLRPNREESSSSSSSGATTVSASAATATMATHSPHDQDDFPPQKQLQDHDDDNDDDSVLERAESMASLLLLLLDCHERHSYDPKSECAPTPSLFSMCIQQCCEEHKLSLALQLLERAEALRLASMHAYACIVQELLVQEKPGGASQQSEESATTTRETSSSSPPPTGGPHTAAVSSLSSSTKSTTTSSLSTNDHTAISMTTTTPEEKRTFLAVELLRRMEQQQVSDLHRATGIYTSVVSALGRLQTFQAAHCAEELLRGMPIPPSTQLCSATLYAYTQAYFGQSKEHQQKKQKKQKQSRPIYSSRQQDLQERQPPPHSENNHQESPVWKALRLFHDMQVLDRNPASKVQISEMNFYTVLRTIDMSMTGMSDAERALLAEEAQGLLTSMLQLSRVKGRSHLEPTTRHWDACIRIMLKGHSSPDKAAILLHELSKNNSNSNNATMSLDHMPSPLLFRKVAQACRRRRDIEGLQPMAHLLQGMAEEMENQGK
ncbi:hypothetical protein ACA910_006312 [Epithemia clementina (nom. ined.)]